MLKSIAHKLDGFHRDFPGQWCGYLDRALGGAEHQHGVIEAALSAGAEPSAPVEREPVPCPHPNVVPRSQLVPAKFLGFFCKDCDQWLGMDRAALERKQ
ncbi:hypothetical protein D3C77_693440 [compost metagenome]